MAKDMGKNGAEFVKNEFNWERVAKNFLEIIQAHLS